MKTSKKIKGQADTISTSCKLRLIEYSDCRIDLYLAPFNYRSIMMGTEPSMRFKGGVILKTKMEKRTKYIHTLLIRDSLFPGFLILDLSWYRFCFLYFFVDPWFHAILFISFPSLHLSNDGFEPSILEDKQIIAKMMIFKCKVESCVSIYVHIFVSSTSSSSLYFCILRSVSPL